MSWRKWIRTVEIEPAVAAANPAKLERQVEVLLRAGCRIFHLDIDETGHELIERLAPLVHAQDGVLDIHLVGETRVLEAILSGADSVTVDPRDHDAAAASSVAREHGTQFGVVFPETQPVDLLPLPYGSLDLVLVEVDGSAGSLIRVREIASNLRPGLYLQVEGALTLENITPYRRAGATSLVVGQGIFVREDLPRIYRRLVQAMV